MHKKMIFPSEMISIKYDLYVWVLISISSSSISNFLKNPFGAILVHFPKLTFLFS